MTRPSQTHAAHGDDAPDDDLGTLLAHVDDPRRWTWVLDFDGVLAPIVDHPDDAVLADGAWDAIAALAEICEVALLSGRALGDLRRRLGQVPPRVLLVGGHGSEARLPDGTRTPLTDLDVARGVIDRVVRELGDTLSSRDRWLIERKATSVAVHHRLVPDRVRDDLLPWVRHVLDRATGDGPGFAVMTGKAVLELKARGVDKGRALRWIDEVSADVAERLPGDPPIRPIVLGDDVTDEDGFAAAVAVGGDGVLVAEAPQPTAAGYRLHDPARVVEFLRAVRRLVGPDALAGVPGGSWHEVEAELGGDTAG